ncbi:hypothetical protein V2J09_011667 [Rumex salicifolius]
MVAMVAKLMLLRPNSPTPYLFLSQPFRLSHILLRPFISSAAITTAVAASPLSRSSTFAISAIDGPSLRKGSLTYSPSNPTTLAYDEGDVPLEEDHFTRVYDIAALRVPSDRCYALENRLRGHLLNWPRIRNIARVPGDEIDGEIQELLSVSNGAGSDCEAVTLLNRRIHGKADGDGDELSPVLFRDKLAKEFNSRGFVRFRNLAKISRPKRNRKKKDGQESGDESEKESGRPRRESVMVEVVEEEDEDGDLSGLLGDAFKGRRWRWSTRLLLLDEKYATKQVDELPDAVKAAIKEDSKQGTENTFELVRCKLTLFYDYWSMNEVLEALLPENTIAPSAFESVGHIAHLNLIKEHLPYKKLIAQVVLDKNKPKIQTVVNKVDAISNDYRTMQLEVLAGNHSLVTTVIENGIRFQVDLAMLCLVFVNQRNDWYCIAGDVFSGVGPIAIAAAKKVKYVYANDLNPTAVDYLERNCVLNRLERKIENKPRDKRSTLPMIHVYGFSKAEDPEFDFHERIRIGLSEVAVAVEMRRVRVVAPGKWMLCASFVLPETVAYRRTSQSLENANKNTKVPLDTYHVNQKVCCGLILRVDEDKLCRIALEK